MAEDIGPVIPVQSIAQEYAHVAAQVCACGGHFHVLRQALLEREGRAYDLLEVACSQCRQQGQFLFDISSFFGHDA